ncbi:exo-alpha-sialidase [Arthrobacter sp. MYb224]|uniref:sialidase family protein n=1 Tax=Micrococcaceae TaxID=1268 RepID=UPI000CFC09C7|nr:sialidase family protein [Arthrobacter sp. MYb224]PQZ99441.1 exo-alpha-sialidase [Arthrobacter sp. MYb224]
MSDRSPNFSSQILATRGVNGHRQYRIPALAVTTAGTVLAAYDGRPNLDDLPNTIDLLLRRSTDHGLSWGAQLNIRTGTGLQGFGDPSLVVDQQTSRIFCFHAAGTHAGFFESVEGIEPEDTVQHVDLAYSDDDGLSWRYRRITEQLKRPGITGIFAAAGAGIQLTRGRFAGRLVQQMVLLENGVIKAASAYSDDHGETWTLGESTAEEANENKVAELSDGRVLLNSRAPGHRVQAVSSDGGHSYGPLIPVPSLPDPGDNGSIFSIENDKPRPILLATNNRDSSLRRNTVLSVSFDAGTQWQPVASICPGSSAYSTGTRLADGSLGVLLEDNGYTNIVFARLESAALSESALRRAADTYTDLETGPFNMVLRSITPGQPEKWVNVGEFHVISANAGEWGHHAWKEVGQGYAGGDQILGTREAQEANYGAPKQGLRAGDILAFTGRFSNEGKTSLKVALNGNFDGDLNQQFPEAVVPPGKAINFFTPTYTLTSADIERGSAEVRCSLDAGEDSWHNNFVADTATGIIHPSPA